MSYLSRTNFNPAIRLVLLMVLLFTGAVNRNQQAGSGEVVHKAKSAGLYKVPVSGLRYSVLPAFTHKINSVWFFKGFEKFQFNVVQQKTETMETQQKNITTAVIEPDGNFPNNDRFPVLIYEPEDLDLSDASDFEKIFRRNNWKNSWRNGIFSMHHYHSITHEVLGIYGGEAKVQLGGQNGQTFTLKKGQVVVLPAGVSHKNLGSSPDFACVGAYPGGSDWDMNYGRQEEVDQALDNISQVGLPDQDPLYGQDGPLFEHWE